MNEQVISVAEELDVPAFLDRTVSKDGTKFVQTGEDVGEEVLNDFATPGQEVPKDA